jgi:hypothetical protein
MQMNGGRYGDEQILQPETVAAMQTMKNSNPLFDPATHYRVELRGRVDIEWLQSFDSSVEISFVENRQVEEITAFDLHTDQAGIVGLLRRLHGLGMTILRLQIVLDEGRAAKSDP